MPEVDIFETYKELLISDQGLVDEFLLNSKERTVTTNGEDKKELVYIDPSTFTVALPFSGYMQYCSKLFASTLLNNIEDQYEKIKEPEDKTLFLKEVGQKIDRYLKRLSKAQHLSKYPFFYTDLKEAKNTFFETYLDNISLEFSSSAKNITLKWESDVISLCHFFDLLRNELKSYRSGKPFLGEVADETLAQFICDSFVDENGASFPYTTIHDYLRQHRPAKRNFPSPKQIIKSLHDSEKDAAEGAE